MKSEKGKSLVPNLRFKNSEGQDFGDWIQENLGKQAIPVSLKNRSGKNLPVFTNSAIDGLVNQKDYFDKAIANQSNLSNYTIIENGDYIYNPRVSLEAPVGPISKNKIGIGLVSPLYLVFRFFKKPDDYFEYFFKSRYWQKALKAKANSGARHDRMSISINDLMEIFIPIPLKPEQQKIADCLASLDELIAAHTQNLEALKAHKKGLLEQLFPVNGQKVPRLRFKEFEGSGEWIFESFDRVFDFRPTVIVTRNDLVEKGGSIQNIHYGDIHKKLNTWLSLQDESIPFINPTLKLKIIKKEAFCREGDLVFADASEDLVDVGKCVEVVNINGAKVVAGLHTLLARQKEAKLITGFGGFLFASPGIRKQIKKESQGTKVLSISGPRLEGITIFYPFNKLEQQKIVDLLSSITEGIKAQTIKLEYLRSHKAGLLQNLFPNPRTLNQ